MQGEVRHRQLSEITQKISSSTPLKTRSPKPFSGNKVEDDWDAGSMGRVGRTDVIGAESALQTYEAHSPSFISHVATHSSFSVHDASRNLTTRLAQFQRHTSASRTLAGICRGGRCWRSTPSSASQWRCCGSHRTWCTAPPRRRQER